MADSYKNTDAPLRTGELAKPIQINTNNLAAMAAKGPEYIRHVAASSPVQLDRLFHVKTGAEADLALAAGAAVRRQESNRVVKVLEGQGTAVESIYARGDVVRDMTNGRKVTVLKACVGYTKMGRPIHKVSDAKGNVWLVSEKKLQRL